MKNLILSITLCLSGLVLAQNTAKLSYNNTDKSITWTNEKGVGSDGIKVEMDGISTVLHKVSVSFEDFSWHSETPEAIEVLFPNIQSLSMNGANSNPSVIVGFDRFEKVLEYVQNAKKALDGEFSGSNRTTMMESICKTHLDKIQMLYSDQNDLLVGIQKEIAFLEADFESQKELLSSIHKKDPDLVADVSSKNWHYKNLIKNKTFVLQSVMNLIAYSASSSVKTKYTSAPHKIKGEATTLVVHIINRFNASDTISSIKTDLYKNGKFKIDFSAGIGINSILDPSFYIDTLNGAASIEQEEKRDIDLTIFTLMHLNWRVSPCVSLGPTTGVSVSVFDAKPSYLLGGGITLGKQRSVSLSGGASMGLVNQLSRKISSDGLTANNLPLSFSEIPTYKKIKLGYFVSFTYNFTRTRKKIE